ncbi:MAG: hypothetical protein IJQ25_01740, partial [Oscillibacter sp.]|nr:hypothetical protein [Oscillibacter sp.]
LVARGFADALAGLKAEPFDGTVREYFTDDPLVAGLEGCCHAAGREVSYRFSFADSSARVRVLSRVLDGAGQALGDSTCLVERADGSRFALLGLDGFNIASVSSRRLLQLGRVADWASRGKLPCRTETPALAILFPRVESDGRFRSVVVVNPRMDTLRGARLRIRGVPADISHLVWRDMDACCERPAPAVSVDAAEAVTIRRDGADALVEIPDLSPWGAGYFLV